MHGNIYRQKYRDHTHLAANTSNGSQYSDIESCLNRNSTNQSVEKEILGLLALLEKKDPYSLKHSIRVGRYAAMLAYALQLSSGVIYQSYICGLLHDIGEIMTPTRILTKNGPLTEEEFEVIQQHSAASAQICYFSPLLRPLAPILKAHHEREDGRGYPNHLRGKEIPLVARILAVADALDAMTSSRSYRKRMPLPKVRSILLDGAGTQWDKSVVFVALKLLSKGCFSEALYPTWEPYNYGVRSFHYDLQEETSFCAS